MSEQEFWIVFEVQHEVFQFSKRERDMIECVLFLFTDFRERKREGEGQIEWGRGGEKNTDLLFHLLVHSLIDSCMGPDQGSDDALTN